MTDYTDAVPQDAAPEETAEPTPVANDSGQQTPAPLLGCLYCHAANTTSLGETRPLFGLGASSPVITCSACGAVALFEAGNEFHDWRLRYRTISHAPRYYYSAVYLGGSEWMEADLALEISRRGFVQRHRLQQVQHGDLDWLRASRLDPPPPLMSPLEVVYLTHNPASLIAGSRGGKTGSLLARAEGNVQDKGRFFVTDGKLHLLGHQRDWSHKLADIQRVDHTEQYWRIYVGDTGQYYQGENLPNQIDAQLFSAVVKALSKKD